MSSAMISFRAALALGGTAMVAMIWPPAFSRIRRMPCNVLPVLIVVDQHDVPTNRQACDLSRPDTASAAGQS
jgi:hypothetical protein